MAYNNFPASYQPMMYQQPNNMSQQNMYQPSVQGNNIIWVSGEAGAKSYMLAPNTTLPLWDSEAQTIYLKSTDASGMPSMKVLDYTIRDTTANPAPIPTENVDYVTHDELKLFENRITNAIEEVRHESHANHANGRRTKKQSNGGTE